MSDQYYQAGLMAYTNKKLLSTNPYSAVNPHEAHQFNDWLRGWLSGYDSAPVGERPIFHLDTWITEAEDDDEGMPRMPIRADMDD
jgi:hypothetical protein